MIGRSIALDDEMHRCAARARKSASQHTYAARRAQPRDDGGAKCAHHARVALGYALGKELDDLQHFCVPLLGLRRKHRFGSGRFAAATAAVANSLLSRFRAPRALIPRESIGPLPRERRSAQAEPLLPLAAQKRAVGARSQIPPKRSLKPKV